MYMPLRSGENTSVIIETLVVMMAADPIPQIALHAIRNQKDGENGATMQEAVMTTRPEMNTFLLP